MSRGRKPNLVASVHQRLLNIAHETGEDFNLTLIRYATERLLYRLSESEYAQRFVLKGARLFVLWAGHQHRPTRDLDLLAFGDDSPENLKRVFQGICTVRVEDDGMVFDSDSITLSDIREDQEYHGQRVKLTASLGNAEICLQIDIGFGDAIVPDAEECEYPVLLDFPAPRLRCYAKETVIAEKLQAMVALGAINSRVKDLYDIWTLSHQAAFDGQILAKAIASTFERRKTEIPTAEPVALTAEFTGDPNTAALWKAFLERSGLDVSGASLDGVAKDIADFLMPPMQAARQGIDFKKAWPPSGPWQGV